MNFICGISNIYLLHRLHPNPIRSSRGTEMGCYAGSNPTVDHPDWGFLGSSLVLPGKCWDGPGQYRTHTLPYPIPAWVKDSKRSLVEITIMVVCRRAILPPNPTSRNGTFLDKEMLHMKKNDSTQTDWWKRIIIAKLESFFFFILFFVSTKCFSQWERSTYTIQTRRFFQHLQGKFLLGIHLLLSFTFSFTTSSLPFTKHIKSKRIGERGATKAQMGGEIPLKLLEEKMNMRLWPSSS